MTAPREIDKSDQRARRAMWEDFFVRRCPTARDVINSAVGALVLRDAQIADLEARVRELSALDPHLLREVLEGLCDQDLKQADEVAIRLGVFGLS